MVEKLPICERRIPHADAVSLNKRAWAIVNRVAPDTDLNPHGFLQREAFVEVCKYRDARNRLYRRIFWNLAEKAGFESGLTEVEHLEPGRIAA